MRRSGSRESHLDRVRGGLVVHGFERGLGGAGSSDTTPLARRCSITCSRVMLPTSLSSTLIPRWEEPSSSATSPRQPSSWFGQTTMDLVRQLRQGTEEISMGPITLELGKSERWKLVERRSYRAFLGIDLHVFAHIDTESSRSRAR
jgi:hypothetical protein